jgi:ABC-2 type transport system permease protein
VTDTKPAPPLSPGTPAHERAGFTAAVAAEWIKLRTLRSTVWTLTAMAALTVGVAVLVAATASLQPGDTVLSASLGNAAVGQLAAAAFGALIMCGEYGSGTVRATFTACPRRTTVLLAKAFTVTAVVFVVAAVAAVVAYQVGAVMLDGHGHAPGEPWPGLLGIAACYAAVAVLGLGVGTAVRHTGAAITAITAVLLLPTLLGPLLGGWQPWLAGSSPLAALQKLAHGDRFDPHALGTIGGWPSLWLVCGYSLATLAASGWLLHRRDA